MVKIDLSSGFDWDKGNQEKNLKKHGLGQAAIESVFERLIVVAPQVGKSENEERYFAVGLTREGRYVFVAYALRGPAGKKKIRPISARYMHAREVGNYEKGEAKGPKIQD